MTKQERHLTIGQLSALLDGQLSSEEQAQSEAHLRHCQQCQQALESLRQTVTLLHAMPQPELPRSFVLPAAPVRAVTPLATRAARTLTSVPTPTPLRRSGWPAYIHGAFTTLSGLAAILGIFFLLSSLFGTIIHVGGSASEGTAYNSSPPTQSPRSVQPAITPGVAGVRTPNVQGTPGGAATTPTPSLHKAGADNHVVSQPNLAELVQAIFAPSFTGIRALLGVLLLLIGFVGLHMLARQRARSYP